MTAIYDRSVTFSADLRVNVAAVEPEASEGRRPVLELRLARRDPVSGVWARRAAGFRIPLHAASDLRSAIEKVAVRALEHAAWGPLAG